MTSEHGLILKIYVDPKTRVALSNRAVAQGCTVEELAEEAIAESAFKAAPFQERVAPWMTACFGPTIPFDRVERCDRLFEEAAELVQASGYSAARAHALVDYVFGRPVGELPQEVGGVMVTLAAFCLAHGVDMQECGETELTRIWGAVEKIRAKQAAKPVGSALPVALVDEAAP